MNLRTLNKFLAQNAQRRRCLLTVQDNVNRCGAAHYTVNFYQKHKNYSSQTLFSKQLRQKDSSFVSAVPLYMNFQKRYISDKDIIINIPKDRQNKPPMESTDPIQPDFQGIQADESTIMDAFECPKFLVEFSQSKPVLYVQDAIIQLHHETGLPWWATIIIAGIAIRTTFIFPLAANQMRIKAKLQKMDNELSDYKKKLKNDYSEYKRHYGWPDEMFAQKYAHQVRLKERELYKTNKIHPNKVYFLVIAQVSTWLCTSLAIRNLCHELPPSDSATEIYKEMSHDGYGWFTDLTLVDQYSIVPFLVCLTNVLVNQAHRLFLKDCFTYNTGVKYSIAQMGTLMMIPIMISAPLAINIYWLTSSLFGLIQVYLLHSPFMLRLLRTPPLDSKEPYRFYYKLWKSNKKDAQ